VQRKHVTPLMVFLNMVSVLVAFLKPLGLLHVYFGIQPRIKIRCGVVGFGDSQVFVVFLDHRVNDLVTEFMPEYLSV